MGLQEIELASPVLSNGENADLVIHHIGDRLSPAIFQDYLVNKANTHQVGATILPRDFDLFAFARVECVRRIRNNQIVSQCTGTLERRDMAIVQAVKCPLGNHTSRHVVFLCDHVPSACRQRTEKGITIFCATAKKTNGNGPIRISSRRPRSVSPAKTCQKWCRHLGYLWHSGWQGTSNPVSCEEAMT